MKTSHLFLALACSAAPITSSAVNACAQGYVWREAFRNDTTCVTPDRRAAAWADNRAAGSRVKPGGGAYGPATCREGFVWREARPGDLVCVTPVTRQLTANENRAGPRHGIAQSGAGTPNCGNSAACSPQARALQARLAANRREKAAKERQLAEAQQRHQAMLEQLRRDDEAWARKNPGLGRSTQPSIADDVTPLRNQIEALDKAYAETQRQLAQLQASGTTTTTATTGPAKQ